MKPRLLVIDDERDIVDSLVMALENDYEVHTASNGRIALDRLTSEPFAVVLLDLMIPVISGQNLLVALHGKLHPPIVVLSASHDLDETCARLGVTHYLQKPYRLPELFAKIADARRGSTGSGDIPDRGSFPAT
jgi:two-component system response regulator VanR